MQMTVVVCLATSFPIFHASARMHLPKEIQTVDRQLGWTVTYGRGVVDSVGPPSWDSFQSHALRLQWKSLTGFCETNSRPSQWRKLKVWNRLRSYHIARVWPRKRLRTMWSPWAVSFQVADSCESSVESCKMFTQVSDFTLKLLHGAFGKGWAAKSFTYMSCCVECQFVDACVCKICPVVYFNLYAACPKIQITKASHQAKAGVALAKLA